MKIQLNKYYLIFALLLFTTEVLIAIYLPTGFIRYTFGDLAFAFLIEFLQLLNILDLLNLQHNHLLKLILGSTFQISDLVAYTFGIISILIIENQTCQVSLKL